MGESEVIGTLLAVALLLILGAPAAMLMATRRTPAFLLGSSFLLGCGIAYALLSLLSILGIPWSVASLAISYLSALAVLVLFTIRRRPRILPAGPSSTVARILDGLTVLCVINHAWYAASSSLWTWERWTPLWRRDFWGIWGLKAAMFLDARKIDWHFLENPVDPITHPDYPLLFPLVMDFAGILSGSIEHPAMGILTSAFGAALLLMLRDLWSEDVHSPWLAALATFCLTPAALSVNVGMAEGPLLAYSTAAVLLIRRFQLRGGTLQLAAVLLGLAALTKNEGMSLAIAVFAVFVLHPALRRHIVQLWPAAALMGSWLMVRTQHRLQTDLFENLTLTRVVERLSSPGQLLELAAVPSLEHPWFWTVVTIGLALGTMETLRREIPTLGIVMFQLLFFAAAYLVSPHSLGWHVSGSWGRLIAQLGPLLGFLALRCLIDAVLASAVGGDPGTMGRRVFGFTGRAEGQARWHAGTSEKSLQ